MIKTELCAALLAITSLAASAQQAYPDAQPQASALQRGAVEGQAADVGTTAVGLALGATEANPLGVVALGLKAVAYQSIKRADPIEQPTLWSAYKAAGWGAAANNLCVIGIIFTAGAGAAVCPLVGLAAGLKAYSDDEEARERATFDAICDQERAANPAITCTYTPRTKEAAQ